MAKLRNLEPHFSEDMDLNINREEQLEIWLEVAPTSKEESE